MRFFHELAANLYAFKKNNHGNSNTNALQLIFSVGSSIACNQRATIFVNIQPGHNSKQRTYVIFRYYRQCSVNRKLLFYHFHINQKIINNAEKGLPIKLNEIQLSFTN